MSRMIMLCASVIFCVAGYFCASAAGVEESAGLPECESTERLPGYALVMANGMTLKISEYCIDLEKSTVYFKSELSGLSATFPLERIQRVVSFDARLAEVPRDAMPLFIPEKTAGINNEDDGGIPVLFKITKTIVGSGSNNGYTRAGGSRSATGRNSYTASKSSGSSSSRTSSSSVSGSSGRTSATSSNAAESSSADANNFFDALFGGK